MTDYRKDREERLVARRPGAWATSSQDYLRLATDLFEFSAKYAERFDHNCSPYPLAGVPLLVSTLRLLLIEANAGILGLGKDLDTLKQLSQAPNEVSIVRVKYLADAPSTADDFALLQEVRNEIVHPSPMPAGSPHNTPRTMLALRDRGLLQSTGKADADFVWIEQLQSHRVFRWAFITTEAIAKRVIDHHVDSNDTLALPLLLESYRRFREHDDVAPCEGTPIRKENGLGQTESQ